MIKEKGLIEEDLQEIEKEDHQEIEMILISKVFQENK